MEFKVSRYSILILVHAGINRNIMEFKEMTITTIAA